MGRTDVQNNQCKKAMRVGGFIASKLLQQANRDKRVKPGADACSGRDIHGDAVLRDTADDGGIAGERIRRKPQENSAVVAVDGTMRDISEAQFEQKRFWTQDISVFVERNGDRATEPCMVNGHNVYTVASWFRVSGSGDGLVQPIRVVMGDVCYDGDGVLCIGAGMGVETREAGNLQFRSGFAVYERGFYGETGGAWDTNQHGWTRAGVRQHIYRKAMENGEVRGCVSEELRERFRGAGRAVGVFYAVQQQAAASVFGISYATGGLFQLTPKAAGGASRDPIFPALFPPGAPGGKRAGNIGKTKEKYCVINYRMAKLHLNS